MNVDLQDSCAVCKPAPRWFPYREHRTMHQVMFAEFMRRDRSLIYLTFPQWCEVTYG